MDATEAGDATRTAVHVPTSFRSAPSVSCIVGMKPNLLCFLSTATKHLLLAFACDPPLHNQAEILAVALIGMGGFSQHGMHAVQSPLGTWELEGWAARSKRVDTGG